MRALNLGALVALAGCTSLNPAYGGAEGTAGTGGAGGGASTTGEGPGTGSASDSDQTGSTQATDDDTEGERPTGSGGHDGESSSGVREELCGNGVLDLGEECDDGNLEPQDGCTGECFLPVSCLEIIEAHPDAPDGAYLIDPDGAGLLEVFCDMTSDGGGYTFFSVELQSNVNSMTAEQLCEDFGMQLWIPRSPAHRQTGCGLGNPDRFMRILGVYPGELGATCGNQPMNSDNRECGWVAGDGGPFWVHDSTSHSEPNGSAGLDQSAWYDWNEDCTINFMDDQGGQDVSDAFYCDVGDKWGAR